MQKLSVNEIIDKIEAKETFSAVSIDYSFTLKIESYVPYVCAAVHDGHQFRKELWNNCLHTEYERWYEEDPETKNMLGDQPIIIAGMDSRFEYDLNRDPESAIYKDAWGKQLWKTPLPISQIEKSLNKHHNFYKVVHALITKIEKEFSTCVVYDMHSYNWKRWDREVPTWNLGIDNVDNLRFKKHIENWSKSLSQIQLPNNIKNTSKINDTFRGNGYFLKYITQNFSNTLVLATEIAKIYCDEYNYIMFPEVVKAVEKQLQLKIKIDAEIFYKTFSK